MHLNNLVFFSPQTWPVKKYSCVKAPPFQRQENRLRKIIKIYFKFKKNFMLCVPKLSKSRDIKVPMSKYLLYVYCANRLFQIAENGGRK